MESVVLRPVRPEDQGSLFALFSATRGFTIALAPVDEARRAFLLKMQFTAQQRGYAAQYTEAGHSIVMVEGRAAGRRVRCSVSSANPGALRFHERLGFRATGGDAMYVQMEWGGMT